MNYSKANAVSKNKKKTRSRAKAKGAKSRQIDKKQNVKKIENNQLPTKWHDLKTETKSAVKICYILIVTALGLLCLYWASIQVYWQQTYHAEFLITNSLSANDKTVDLSDVNTVVEQNQHSENNNNHNNHKAVIETVTDVDNATKTEALHEIKREIKTEIKNSESNIDKLKIEDEVVTEHNAETQEKSYSPSPIILTANDKVFFAGDSLMQGVAPYVKKMLFKQYKIEGIDFSKQSTGLAYPRAFDWPKKISETLDEDPAIKLLIVFLGPNDPWDFPVKGYSQYARFKSELWEEQYRLRIENILNSAMQHNVQVLWLAAPCMRKAKLNDGMVYLNLLYQSEIEKVNQHFLPTNELLGCTYENFSNFIANDKGKIKVRIDDGIHFTPTGQKILAKAITEQIIVKELEDSNSD